MPIHYISCTTTEIGTPTVYAEVKVLRREKEGYDPIKGQSGRLAELNKTCDDFLKRGVPFLPTRLAEWIVATLVDVREVGVFNADGCGVILSVE